ncbi:hypothetical protein VL12_16320 [Rossellomorea marisflavi]|nr:hypothetical protein VL12_16320 [Rossellomorea marisflavi]
MKAIFSQPFMQTERRIEEETQKTIETVGYIHLYKDRIETPSNVFVIGDVFDVTSRSLSAGYCFLYLHTIIGVRTFIIKSSPQRFILHYRSLK